MIGEAQADGTPIRDYIYLDGELLAVKEHIATPGLYLYINDHLGTPQKLIRPDDTIVWQAAYLPFGKAQIMYDEVTNNFVFLASTMMPRPDFITTGTGIMIPPQADI